MGKQVTCLSENVANTSGNQLVDQRSNSEMLRPTVDAYKAAKLASVNFTIVMQENRS